MKQQPIMGRRFDLNHGEIIRIARLGLLGKFVPLGNMGGGPGLRCIIALVLTHYLGRSCWQQLVRHEHTLARLYLRLHALKGRISKKRK